MGHNRVGTIILLMKSAAFAVNGIPSAWAEVDPTSRGSVPGFLVKDWSPSQANLPLQLCLNPAASTAGDIMVPTQPGGVYCDLTSLSTLAGQNTQPPSEKIFNSHFIVMPGISGVPTYVDPSYGATYMSPANFEQKAVYWYGDLGNPQVNSNGKIVYIVTPPISGVPQIGITLTQGAP
jgi:hypothetical protein